MVEFTAEPSQPSLREGRSAGAYAAPIVVFAVLTALEGVLPAGAYPAFYIVKIAAVTAALVYFRGPLGDIRPSWGVVPLGVAVGLVVFAEWVIVDRLVSYPHLGTRVGYNPFAAIEDVAVRWAFLVARFYGLVLVVPVMEELFWRSFLLRYATTADFTSLTVGQFSADCVLDRGGPLGGGPSRVAGGCRRERTVRLVAAPHAQPVCGHRVSRRRECRPRRLHPDQGAVAVLVEEPGLRRLQPGPSPCDGGRATRAEA